MEKLFNILASDKPSILLKKEEEYVFSLIPELKKCKGFNQNNPWHIYDVYEHILHVVDGVDNDLILRLAALFHDVGKPACYVEDQDGIGHFRGHWKVSKDLFKKFAINHSLDKKMMKKISTLIFYHDIHIDSLQEQDIENLVKNFDKNDIKQLFNLKRSDLLAQAPAHHNLLEKYNMQEQSILKKYCK